jgi:putative transposase
MPEYRRVFLEGDTYFFTVVTYNRLPIFNNKQAITQFRMAVKDISLKLPFNELAYCILPDHIHCLWKLPDDDCNYSLRWRAIKSTFTRWYQEQIGPGAPRNESRIKRAEAAIWQRRFWEHTIRDQEDLNNHIDYIHFNPVKHGLVEHASDWKMSSFQFFVDHGYYPNDWGEVIQLETNKKSYGE